MLSSLRQNDFAIRLRRFVLQDRLEAFVHAPVVEVTLLVGVTPVLALGIHRLRGLAVSVPQLFGVPLAVGGRVAFRLPGHTRRHKAQRRPARFRSGEASAVYAIQLRRMQGSDSPPDPICTAAIACLVGAILGAALLALFGSPTHGSFTATQPSRST